MPVEAAKSEVVEQEAPMEVDTPDTSAKEENVEPVEENMDDEDVKIIHESAPAEPEKAEPEPVAAKEEVIIYCHFVAFC